MRIKFFRDKKVSIFLVFAFLVNLFSSYNLGAFEAGGISSFGKIVETFNGNSSGKIVIINDLHLNKSVQENIYQILKGIKAENGKNFTKVYLEGLEAGKLDLRILNVLPKKEREKYLNIFMEKGLIQGGEKFKFFEENVEVFGAEDVRMYLENFRKFYKSFKFLEDLGEVFKNLENGYFRNRKYFLSSNMTKFLGEKSKFSCENLDLENYIKYLKNVFENENFVQVQKNDQNSNDFFEKYAVLNQVLELSKRKLEINLGMANFEAIKVVEKIQLMMKF